MLLKVSSSLISHSELLISLSLSLSLSSSSVLQHSLNHWFCLFFLLILFITSLNLILINNCNLSLCFSDSHKVSFSFSCFRFTPGLAFGEKDIGHPAITEYLSLTGQGKLRNRKIISERKQTFYGNSLPVRRTDKESIFVGQSDKTDAFQELCLMGI